MKMEMSDHCFASKIVEAVNLNFPFYVTYFSYMLWFHSFHDNFIWTIIQIEAEVRDYLYPRPHAKSDSSEW